MAWTKIPGYPGYSASSDGEVRNDDTGYVTKGGNAGHYLKVSVYKKGDKKPTLCYVHDLVCRAFKGHPPKDHIVGHDDDNKKNNKPGNLNWITISKNTQDAYDNGLIKKKK